MRKMEIGLEIEAGLCSKEGDVFNPVSYERCPALTTW